MHHALRMTAIAGLAAVAAFTSPVTAGGTADKATGGGQILVASDGRGPGDTVTFTAQERADGTTVGNVNVIDRAGDGSGQGFHFRGDVTCIDAVGNTAKVAGTGDGPDGTVGFTLIVVDNGEGSVADNDTITLEYTDDPTCDRENGDNDAAVDLARGNAQVTDGH